MIISLLLAFLFSQSTVPGTVLSDRMFNSLTLAEEINPDVPDNIIENRKWVQNFTQAGWVNGGGTFFAYSNWDEAGNVVGMYKNGTLVNKLAPYLKGIAANWGDITGDTNYVYLTTKIDYGDWYTNGCGVLRSNVITGSWAGWVGGKGKNSSYFSIRDTGQSCALYRNITVDDKSKELFVTDSVNGVNKVIVFRTNPALSTPIDSFELTGIVDMVAFDTTLWVIKDNQVRLYSNRGVFLNKTIPGILKPTKVNISRQNEMMVWDDSLCVVKFYKNYKTTPRLTRTLGYVGGYYAANSKKINHSLKLFPPNLRSLGTDNLGNIYLSWGYAFPAFSDIRSFNKNGDSLWHLYSATFVGVTGFDYTKDGTEAFTTQHKFKIDWNGPPDKKAKFLGYTIPYRDEGTGIGGRTEVIYAKGKRLIIKDNNDLYGNGISIFYEDGLFLRRCFVISNGEQKAFYVDSLGNIWDASRPNIRKINYLGVNRNGVPIWDTANAINYGRLTDISIRRFFYIPSTDEAIVTGYTSQIPKRTVEDKGIGQVVRKYTSFTRNKQLAWQDTVKIDTLWMTFDKAAITVTGEYIFVISIGNEPRDIDVYRKSDFGHVGKIFPGPEVQGDIAFAPGYGGIGWIDFPFGMTSFRRNNGEYVIVIENDLTANNIIYRWCPTGSCQ